MPYGHDSNSWQRFRVESALRTISPVHTVLSVREPSAESLHRPLCESFRCRGWDSFAAALPLCRSDLLLEVVSGTAVTRRHLFKWKTWRRKSGVCRSDGVHSLTAKQILHSSNKREITCKATLQDRTTATW